MKKNKKPKFEVAIGDPMIIEYLRDKIKADLDCVEIPKLSIKELDMVEIMTNALSEMERKLYMILLKNNLKFEYTDDEFEKINFDEYMLEENYDPEKNINIIEMVKK